MIWLQAPECGAESAIAIARHAVTVWLYSPHVDRLEDKCHAPGVQDMHSVCRLQTSLASQLGAQRPPQHWGGGTCYM